MGKNPKSICGSKGFSLLEVLLAVGISALIMGSLTMIFKVTKQSWNRNNTQSELLQHARVAISRLGAELRYTTNLVQADTSAIVFDTKVLVDSDNTTTETIRYEIAAFVLQRRAGVAGTPYVVAGDPVIGGVVAQLFYVQPMKLDASNNVVPLVAGDPLSIAVALDVQLRMRKGNENMVDVRTLAKFRGK